jgi:hypothetical protein
MCDVVFLLNLKTTIQGKEKKELKTNFYLFIYLVLG